MKLLFWLPTILSEAFKSLLPRALFIRTYHPSSEQLRTVTQDARNSIRLAEYKIRRSL